MGKLYETMQAPQLALTEKLKSYSIKPNFFEASTIAQIYLDLKQSDSALIFFRKQLSIANANDDDRQRMHACNNLGYGFSEIEENDSASIYYNKALQLLASLPN